MAPSDKQPEQDFGFAKNRDADSRVPSASGYTEFKCPQAREKGTKRGKLLLLAGIAAGLISVAIVTKIGWKGAVPNASPPSMEILQPAVKQAGLLIVGADDLDLQANVQARAFLASGNIDVESEAADAGNSNAENILLRRMLKTLSPEARQAVASGESLFYKFIVYDFQRQDKDRAEVFINGVSMGVMNITNQGTPFSVPIRRGETVQIQFRAVADGDSGGVTLGAKSSEGETHLRAMNVGEMDGWTVTPK